VIADEGLKRHFNSFWFQFIDTANIYCTSRMPKISCPKVPQWGGSLNYFLWRRKSALLKWFRPVPIRCSRPSHGSRTMSRYFTWTHARMHANIRYSCSCFTRKSCKLHIYNLFVSFGQLKLTLFVVEYKVCV